MKHINLITAIIVTLIVKIEAQNLQHPERLPCTTIDYSTNHTDNVSTGFNWKTDRSENSIFININVGLMF